MRSICFTTRERQPDRVIEKSVSARELFRKIAETNWDYAEPGALFWDRIEGWNLLSSTKEFSYAGVNPCAEEPLPAGGSCLLGSINLAEFVTDPFTEEAQFDMEGFKPLRGGGSRSAQRSLRRGGLRSIPCRKQRREREKRGDRSVLASWGLRTA